MSGEMSCIIMKARGFEALNCALIVLKCDGRITNWISNTGRIFVDVDSLLDAT
jgi:hypothetical protein